VARLVVDLTLESPSDFEGLREAVPGAAVKVCRLAADVATLVERVTRREPPYLQERLSSLARRNARLMEDWKPEDYVVDNDRRSLGAVVRDVVDGSGWLSDPSGS
jgi:hypothetical protein